MKNRYHKPVFLFFIHAHSEDIKRSNGSPADVAIALIAQLKTDCFTSVRLLFPPRLFPPVFRLFRHRPGNASCGQSIINIHQLFDSTSHFDSHGFTYGSMLPENVGIHIEQCCFYQIVVSHHRSPEITRTSRNRSQQVVR